MGIANFNGFSREEFYSASLVPYCRERFRDMSPLHQWLTD
jgi:hypothetical protein